MLHWIVLFTRLIKHNPEINFILFVALISCAGVGHGAGAYGRGVGRDLSVGARPSRLTATDRTEPGSTLGKVNNNSVHTVTAFIGFYFIIS